MLLALQLVLKSDKISCRTLYKADKHKSSNEFISSVLESLYVIRYRLYAPIYAYLLNIQGVYDECVRCR